MTWIHYKGLLHMRWASYSPIHVLVILSFVEIFLCITKMVGLQMSKDALDPLLRSIFEGENVGRSPNLKSYAYCEFVHIAAYAIDEIFFHFSYFHELTVVYLLFILHPPCCGLLSWL